MNKSESIILAKIIKNISSFSQTFLTIRSKKNCVQQLIFNKEQEYINSILEQQKKENSAIRTLILKGRQVGVSTYISARAYHYCLTHKGVRALILSHRQSATNNIFEMIQRYHGNILDFFQLATLHNRNKSLYFTELDSSLVFATAGSNEIGRSDTIQFFHGSEVAFWANCHNHLASILMAVPDKNSEVILESTSNGPRGLFYEMCLLAQKKDNEYNLIFLPWHWHLEYTSTNPVNFSKDWLEYGKIHNLSNYQLAWAFEKNKMLSLGEGFEDKPSFRFYQEFPASVTEAFKYVHQNMLIHLELLQQQKVTMGKVVSNQILQEQYQNSIREPLILGVDIALGGGDFSWIIDRQGAFIGLHANEQISLTDSMQLVGWIRQYIEKLNPLHVCIDAGGGGVGVFDRLVELGYKDIMVLVNFANKAKDSRKYLNKRAEMWGLLQEFLQQDNYIIDDAKLLQQIASVEYFYNSKGQIQLASKENIRKILKQSPDGGDAAALTFGIFPQPNFSKINSIISSNNYNPFTW